MIGAQVRVLRALRGGPLSAVHVRQRTGMPDASLVLRRLEADGTVVAVLVDDAQRFALTPDGEAMVAAQDGHEQALRVAQGVRDGVLRRLGNATAARWAHEVALHRASAATSCPWPRTPTGWDDAVVAAVLQVVDEELAGVRAA